MQQQNEATAHGSEMGRPVCKNSYLSSNVTVHRLNEEALHLSYSRIKILAELAEMDISERFL